MSRHVPTGGHLPGDFYPGTHDHRTEHALHGHGGVSLEAGGRGRDAGDDEYRLIYSKSVKKKGQEKGAFTMGSWRFKNVGASAKPEQRKHVEKIFEYIGIAEKPAWSAGAYDECIFSGSSRKVVGFKPSKRQSKIANEGKEILIVSIAVADTLSHLDFVVEALQFACADRKNGMSGKTVQT